MAGGRERVTPIERATEDKRIASRDFTQGSPRGTLREIFDSGRIAQDSDIAASFGDSFFLSRPTQSTRIGVAM